MLGPDLLIIVPGNNRVIYQQLSLEYSAIEPPIWAGLIAKYVRNGGYTPHIIDQEAMGLTSDEIVKQAEDVKPGLIAVVVYGQQPSASTQNMTMAKEICAKLRGSSCFAKTILIGGHPSALPEKTLLETACDFVAQGEGLLTLIALLYAAQMAREFRLSMDNVSILKRIPGLWYRSEGKARFTGETGNVHPRKMDIRLNGMAWDLLPMDSYLAHNWHCATHIDERKPYASIYTSLGCPFSCSFCCINAPFGKPSIRYWSPDTVIEELDLLASKYGVKNVKIADEMFVLNENHVLGLCDRIIERRYEFNFWAYARVDTIHEKFLDKLKRAGFNWLCLGIESKSKHVRDGAVKGQYTETDIVKAVKRVRDAGINVIANYMFGLPDDTMESMRETLDMAKDMNCEWANFYSGMAYPGSKLYDLAVQKGWKLPEQWHDFSQHSYEQLCLPTGHVPAGEVLGFRDRAWDEYFTNPSYLMMIKEKFGEAFHDHVLKLTTFKLARKYAV